METKNIYQKLFEVKKAGITLQRDTKAFNYQYATLDQIQKKLGEVLQAQGLLVIHKVRDNQVVTEIVNTEIDESIESSIPLTEGTKAQDKGSEITYYRRYNLLSLLDLEVEDDDGKKAQYSKATTKAKPNWYNDLSKHKATYIAKIQAGELTPEAIIKGLEEKGYVLGGPTREEIMNLK